MNCGNFNPPALFLLAGLPGAGKTTFARALLQRAGGVHIESDAVRRQLAPQPRYTADEHRQVFDEVERRAHEELRAGRLVIIDATNLQARHRRRFGEIAAAAGCPVVRVWLTAPEGTITERLSRPRNGHSQAGLEVYRQMLPTAERFAEPAIVVDTRFDTGPSLDLAVALAEAGA